MRDLLKHLLMRTPLERAAVKMNHLWRLRRLRRHPELRELILEPMRVERAITRIIGRRTNCVDVGGHLGSMLSLMLRRAPHGRHHVFEPVPRKAAWLRRRFPEVTVHELALADESGRAEFFVNHSNSGYSGLCRRSSGDANRIERTIVRTARLDEALPPDHRVDFLKVDVEGAELPVLRGADRILDRDRPTILFESTSDGLEAHGLHTHDVFDFLCEAHGYRIHVPGDYLEARGALDARSFHASHQYPFRAFNFIATPTGCRGNADAPPIVERREPALAGASMGAATRASSVGS